MSDECLTPFLTTLHTSFFLACCGLLERVQSVTDPVRRNQEIILCFYRNTHDTALTDMLACNMPAFIAAKHWPSLCCVHTEFEFDSHYRIQISLMRIRNVFLSERTFYCELQRASNRVYVRTMLTFNSQYQLTFNLKQNDIAQYWC